MKYNEIKSQYNIELDKCTFILVVIQLNKKTFLSTYRNTKLH